MKATGYEPDIGETTMSPDKAFVGSQGHQLNGIKLEPYTIERQWAADAMGLRYGRLSKSASKQFEADRTYPGMAGDVAIVIYLCSLTDVEEVRSARREPGLAEERAVAFAQKHKIASPKQTPFWDAYEIHLKIMQEVHESYAEPETQKKTKTTTKK